MFSFIRYTIYLILLLLALFLLQRWGIDVKGVFQKGVENTQVFIENIGNEEMVSKDATSTDTISGDQSDKNSTTTVVKPSTNSTTVIPKKETGMSIAGVLKYTNIERVKYGLQPLVLNKKLSNSAVVKVDDMFTLEYFEHTSPSGKTAADLVRAEGYEFQNVGENLALGDFGSDKKLVDAWMNSPLHRKNILNPKFTELGLAVAKGIYKNNTQWLAVQHFGKPVPVCDEVPLDLKQNVDTEKAALEVEKQKLQTIADEIEADPNQNKAKEFLDAYNDGVAKYNARLGALRDLISEYNLKVELYNTCLAE